MNIVDRFTNSISMEEAQEKLDELNKEISKIVVATFGTIRQDLETNISIKNKQINNNLESIINRANTDFFGYLNQELSIDLLKANEIQLPPIDSLQISNNYDSFLEKRYGKEGGCLFGIGATNVLKEVKVKQNELSAWWKKHISKEKNVSLRTVTSYIDDTIVLRIKNVKETFSGIARNYIQMIDEQCKNINREAEKTTAFSDVLEKSIDKLDSLSKNMKENNF
jgi:hypothetical protein